MLISGASGLIGSALISFLQPKGFEFVKLARGGARSGGLQWDPMAEIAPEMVSGFDAVIHLSGESVAGRWTAEKKKAIRESRVVSTKNLSEALAKAAEKPAVFVCASAIGFYGDRGDEALNEESPAGTGFLADVSQEWEAATVPAAQAGIRVANLRTGIVLAREGGALKQMLLPFRLGLGGRVGSGRQWWSWIHIGDMVAAVGHILDRHELTGPVNMTAPSPVTNAEFTRKLAAALHRPAVIPAPAWALKTAFGEFAEEGMLASVRVEPRKLTESGFGFRYAELGQALEEILR